MSDNLDKRLKNQENRGSLKYSVPNIIGYLFNVYKGYEYRCNADGYNLKLSFIEEIEITYKLLTKLKIEHPIIKVLSDFLLEKDPKQQIKKIDNVKEYLKQQIKEIEDKDYPVVYLIAWLDALAFIKKYGCTEKDKLLEFLYECIKPKPPEKADGIFYK
jgi:hypothetical protein